MMREEWSRRREELIGLALYLFLMALVVLLSVLVPASETYP